MDSNGFILSKLRQDITEQSLQLKAIIQDINVCLGPMAELHALNSAGRAKIAALRKYLDQFGDTAKESGDPKLMKELVSQREQLASNMDAFKKANLKSMLAIEQKTKDELLKPRDAETALKQRNKRDKETMAKMSSNVTDQLLTISKQLAETTQRSAVTLETLLTSSDTVAGTQQELKVTAGAIGQSGKLLAKYGRREFTDKILMAFAFTFFVACVIYIIQKRLF